LQNVLVEHFNKPLFRAIGQAADRLGLETYVVGGYVRDLLLDRASKDIDVVAIGSGIALAKAVAEELKLKQEVKVFKNFGTAMLKQADWEVEFVGARKESYVRNSRKPIVEDGSLEDDQNRRDFSINAMAVCLNQERFGELIDPFNGQQHLADKLIKTPLEPSITFSDDPLRMMRAIRFASQLDFNLDEDAYEAIKKEKGRIEIVSQERITDELNKIILSPKPSKGFKLLFNTGLLELIFPIMTKLYGVEYRDGKGHKDNFYHTLQVLDNISVHTNDLWLRWAAILHDIAKPATKRFDKKQGWTFHGHEDLGARMVPKIFKQLKLPLDQKMKYVQKLVRLHLRPIALVKESVSDSAVRRLLFEAGEEIEDLMLLCAADITTKNPNRMKRYLRNFDLVEEKLKEVEEKDRLRNWQPPVSGETIMKSFDLHPSKEVGMIKSAIREAILDGKIENNQEEALSLMFEEGKKLGLTPKKD
jgi:putative nucleotidyltransferase with HDIG domain